MARVALIEIDRMTAQQRGQYDKFPSNLTRGLLLTEQRLAAALPNLANALRTSGLDPKLREGAILRVAALSRSAYERMQHLEQARKVGWSPSEISAIERGARKSVPAEFVPVLDFIDACVASPQVSREAFDAAKSVLSDRELSSLILLIGHYMMVARFTGVLEIEVDAQADSWTSEH